MYNFTQLFKMSLKSTKNQHCVVCSTRTFICQSPISTYSMHSDPKGFEFEKMPNLMIFWHIFENQNWSQLDQIYQKQTNQKIQSRICGRCFKISIKTRFGRFWISVLNKVSNKASTILPSVFVISRHLNNPFL